MAGTEDRLAGHVKQSDTLANRASVTASSEFSSSIGLFSGPDFYPLGPDINYDPIDLSLLAPVRL